MNSYCGPKQFLPLAVFLATPVISYASKPEQPIAPIVDAGYVFQFLLALALVIGAIFGLMYLLRRLNHLPGKGASAIRVIGGIPLGAREKLVLVQVGETQLLLGMAPGQLRTLHVFDQPVITPEDGSGDTGFASVLGSLTARGKR